MKKSFEFEATTCDLKPFRSQLSEMLSQAGFDDKAKNDVLLAVQEAVTNLIRHAYDGGEGKILVDIEESAESFKVDIRDFGKSFDITRVPDPELPKETPGGLGIFLIKKVMDRVSYESSADNGNVLSLVKNKQRSNHA